MSNTGWGKLDIIALETSPPSATSTVTADLMVKFSLQDGCESSAWMDAMKNWSSEEKEDKSLRVGTNRLASPSCLLTAGYCSGM